ncbi:MAG: hypothetical protein FJ318_10385, partial [SAR202 cluster bacterium]|nr:hypothetical protein [SAR202 cluster bacterium]
MSTEPAAGHKSVPHAWMLLTHTHWDHINGFPFFAPAFSKTHSFDIMAGHLSDRGGVKGVLSSQM